MPMTDPDDDALRRILTATRCIAVVGFSASPHRPSHSVAAWLARRGLRVIPVNPGLAGQVFLGETVRAGVEDCPPEVDMIDVFRRSEHVPPVVESAIAHLPGLRTVWLQLGVHSPESAVLAQARGLDFVENRCTAIEFRRLLGG